MYHYINLPWGDGIGLYARGGYGTERFEDRTGRDIHYYNSATSSHQLLTGNNPRSNYNFGGDMNYQICFAKWWSAIPTISYDQNYKHISSEYMENEQLHPSSYNSDLLSRTGKATFKLNYMKDGGMVLWTSEFSMARKYENYHIHELNAQSKHSRYSWLPNITSTFLYQKGIFFYCTYNLAVSAPQMNMMYGPVNTFNPLVTVYRSDGLKNTVTNNFEANCNKDFNWHKLNLYASLSWQATHGKVSYKKATDLSTGHYEYMPGNVDGNWNYSFSVYANMNLDKQGLFNLSSTTAHQYIHDVDFDISTNGLSDLLSKVNNNSIKEALKLTYKKNNFQIGLNGSILVNHISSNRNDFNNFTYYQFNYGVNLYTPLLWKFNLTTDFSVYSKRGYTVESMNTNDFVWNASLSRSLFKKKLTASLEAYDLLHQLSKNRLSVNSQGRTEMHVNTIPNYLMLKLQYSFQLSPKKK